MEVTLDITHVVSQSFSDLQYNTIQYNIKFVEQRHHSAAGRYRLMIAEALGRRKVKGSRMAAVNQKETF